MIFYNVVDKCLTGKKKEVIKMENYFHANQNNNTIEAKFVKI